MAKKIVSPDPDAENRGKGKVKVKKRSVCCTCLMVLAVFFVIIFALVFSVGWVIGDMFSKEYLGMPIGKTVGLINELYWKSDKDVVTNPYSADDAQGFYNELKTNILLKEDADIDFEAALEAAIKEFLKSSEKKEEEEEEPKAKVRVSADGDYDYTEPDGGENPDGDNPYEPEPDPNPDNGDEGNGDKSGVMDILVNMVAEVFTRENIDVEKLSAYDEEHDEYIFNLNDKQLAAFINSVLTIMLEEGVADSLGETVSSIDLSKVLALKQIRFDAVGSANEQNEHVVTATTADITVWIGLQEIAKQSLTSLLSTTSYNWASGLVGWLSTVILPKNLYATITVPLTGEEHAQVTINAMNAQHREAIYLLVDHFMGDTEGGIQGLLDSYAGMVTPYVEAAGENIDFSSASHGTLKIDLIGALADKASGEDTPESEKLRKSDFMYMLQAILASDPDARLEQLQSYLFDKWYASGDKLEYDPSDKTDKTLVKYDKQFLSAIQDKYAVNFGDDAELADVFGLFGISMGGGESSGGGTQDILGLIDKKAFKSNLSKTNDELKLYVTDRMLAAALAPQLGSLTGDMELELTLRALTFLTAEIDGKDHDLALLAVELDIKGILQSMGGDNMLVGLATNIMPEKIVLSVTVDVTRSLEANTQYLDTSFMFNDYENTDRVLDTLRKLANVDIADSVGGIESTLRDLMDDLYEKLDISIVPSAITENVTSSAALVLPDIFTVVNKMVINDPDISADDLRLVLDALVNPQKTHTEQPVDNYFGDVIDKYYLAADAEPQSFQDLVDFVSAFDASKFRITPPETGEASALPYLAYDNRLAKDLVPIISEPELARLIKEQTAGDGESSGAENFEFLEVNTTDETLSVVLSVKNIDELLPADILSILDISVLYVTANIDIRKTENQTTYPVGITVNDMSAETYGKLVKIINHFGALDIDSQVAEFGQVLYDQIGSLRENLGLEVEFCTDGLMLGSFYEFLAVKLDIAKEYADGSKEYADPETVKEALQGMYEKPASGAFSKYNYVKSEFLTNIPPEGTTYTKPDYTDLGFIQGTKTFRYRDVEFNGFFQGAMTTGGFVDVTAVQTIAFVENAASDERTWANEMIANSPIAADGQYLLVTFDMKVDKSGVGSSSEAEEGSEAGEGNETDKTLFFLPDGMFVTVALEKTKVLNNDYFVYVGTIFNNMSPAARLVVLDLMNMSDDSNDDGKINVHSVISQCLTVLNGNPESQEAENRVGIVNMADISFVSPTASDEDCVGVIELRRKLSIQV